MRRIDLFCKLFAPIFISFLDSWSTEIAIWTVVGLNVSWVMIEYLAVTQVGRLSINFHLWGTLRCADSLLPRYIKQSLNSQESRIYLKLWPPLGRGYPSPEGFSAVHRV
jgi:Ferroportin1 (FPN1)